MVVIYVICAVIVFIIYSGAKLKIEEWLKETRMSRLSLKRRNSTYECSPGTSTVEVPTDENNDLPIYELVETESSGSSESLISDISYDEETMPKFEKYTHYIRSDEDIDPYDTNVKLKITESYWKIKKSLNNHRNNNNFSDSDSSDDFQSTESQHMHERKKQKNNAETIETEIRVEADRKVEETVAQVAIQHEQLIAGINVKLPVKPYSSQVAVMHKVIQGCMKEENCLLESPTGSGKTLALLCGVLAWHDHHVADVQRQRKKLEMSVGRFIHEDPSRDDEPTTSREDNGEDSNKKCVDDSYEDDNSENIFDDEKLKKIKVSKIYYGTRTHKQIEQVVRELKKTSYGHKKMAILSSREHTCIQQSTKNKTELCNELLDPMKHKGCPFYNESNKKKISTFQAVESRGLAPVWDIEDLVTIGKDEGSCPYFAARSLADKADIIFCPYNYIVNPDIRESMQLDLKGQVIILDEAHNIEDICREVASVSFREDHLQVVVNECESLAKGRSDENPRAYNILCMFISRVLQFLGSVNLSKSNYNNEIRSSPYWTGPELSELFDIHFMNKPLCASFIEASYTAISDMNKAKEESKISRRFIKPVISPATKNILDHLVFAIRMINFTTHVNDYRACVTEAIVNDLKAPTGRIWSQLYNDWLPAKHRKQHARTLKLMCMNPGVIFTPLAQNARSIILASGTLSPTATFQSELGTSFPHVLKTSHVIPKEQVYATCIPQGPQKVTLRGTFPTVNSWSFQDEIGRVVLDICESIPHGILCFFSSYNVMHKHIERWKTTFTLSKISDVKHVFIEPRYGGDLADIMTEYRQVIEQTSAKQTRNVTGALLLAVFRGKVAEGIDFKDDEARCVVTVGIPYPVRNDPMVEMKMAYNDKKVKNGLLRGSDWYSTQAFRALNQALGRCLRHIHDWGALLLIDERFLQDENKENLPKWVKTMWVNREEYTLKKDLRHFVARQKMRDAKQPGISN
ncbi:hypothetical protein QLX08_005611 [Tetragonisca angustula]|uniref:DNA 5'-3' helicase n=1 Tax=Tetragonisca angustula TaxID=166442 RepID=A0AAW1A042_9HYME